MIIGGIWGVMLILAPLILIGAFVWSRRQNRTAQTRSLQETEEATRELYEEKQPEVDRPPR